MSVLIYTRARIIAMDNMNIKRGRGRPRAFDREAVLERAMQVFWSTGYETTAVPLLAEAMGISVQSLYAAFGSKEALFREALDSYSRTIGGFGARALASEPDAIRAVARLLDEAAMNFSRTTGTPGCMITMAAVDTPLSGFGQQLRAASEAGIAVRLQQGIEEGQLPAGFDCAHWASYIGCVVLGMSVQARDGAKADALQFTASTATAALEANRVQASIAKKRKS